jgi:hypothetical protein
MQFSKDVFYGCHRPSSAVDRIVVFTSTRLLVIEGALPDGSSGHSDLFTLLESAADAVVGAPDSTLIREVAWTDIMRIEVTASHALRLSSAEGTVRLTIDNVSHTAATALADVVERLRQESLWQM